MMGPNVGLKYSQMNGLGIKQGIGEIQSTKNLIAKAISERSEYEMLLDDGRRGKIIITNINSDNPKRGSFKTSGPLE